ncbi:MAG: hypothetical protein JW704_07120 [Anaerolineaceae bacterium]|nr:hypothetical protein [Anaerolineaceae bacterium]MBN2677272.1 hypothetical protein [Anaerolineaceae bacterium]
MDKTTKTKKAQDQGILRIEIEKAILNRAGLNQSTNTDHDSLLRLVSATNEAAELCTRLHRDAVHQARRAEIPWSEIGAEMGITRQAVQQRFAPEEMLQTQATDIRTIPGATAFNEMQILEHEGKAGYHLVGFGPLYLTVKASNQKWEHRRLFSFNMTEELNFMEKDGWTYVGSWFPFHYFKRVVS